VLDNHDNPLWPSTQIIDITEKLTKYKRSSLFSLIVSEENDTFYTNTNRGKSYKNYTVSKFLTGFATQGILNKNVLFS